MKYLLASAAILCMLLTAGCGHEPLYENSAEMSATEETESSTESIEIADVS